MLYRHTLLFPSHGAAFVLPLGRTIAPQGATREVSVLVLFGERECARWYPCLVMDKNYLITRLRPAKLFEQSYDIQSTNQLPAHVL